MKCLVKRHNVIGIDKIPSLNVIKLDLTKNNIRLNRLFKGIDIVIHLAWNTKEGGTALEPVLEENKKMGEIVLKTALNQKVKRVILASSVHVSFGHIGYEEGKIVKDHSILHRHKKISVDDKHFPLGAYGASKLYLEALGRAYSTRGLQVIAVRFGNITPGNSFGEYPFWLSHRDCCQFIEKCCAPRNLPAYSTFYAVSDNACNPFDISNARKLLKYKPRDSSPCPFDFGI